MEVGASEKIDLVSGSDDTEDLSSSDDYDDLLSVPLRSRLLVRAAADRQERDTTSTIGTCSGLSGPSGGSGGAAPWSGEQGWCAIGSHAVVQARWLWNSGRQGSIVKWSAYSTTEGRQVEAAYRRFGCAPSSSLALCRVTIGTRAYIINFEHLTQAPAAQPGRTRKIRREERRIPRALVSLDVLHALPRTISARAAAFGAVHTSLRSHLVRVDSSQVLDPELHSVHGLAGCVAVVPCDISTSGSYVDTARQLQTAGALGVLFVSTGEELNGLVVREGEPHDDVTIPCVCVGRRSGDQLIQDLATATAEAPDSVIPETRILLRLRPPCPADGEPGASAAACTVPCETFAAPAIDEPGAIGGNATTHGVLAQQSAEPNCNFGEVQLVDTSSDEDDAQADVYGPSSKTEPSATDASIDNPCNSPSISREPANAVSSAACEMDETLLLESPCESSDDRENSVHECTGDVKCAASTLASAEVVPTAPTISAIDEMVTAATASVPIASTSSVCGKSSSTTRRSTAASRSGGKTRRTTQLQVGLEQSLHGRGDGGALAVHLRQEKSLQPEAWEVMSVQISVPYAVLFTRLTRAVPYKRPTAALADDADNATNGTTVAQTLLPRIAVVVPMAVLFAIIDAGGLAAVAGHLEAVRSCWWRRQQQQQQQPEPHRSEEDQTNDGACCVVHYVLESLPRSEKERAAVLRQHAPRVSPVSDQRDSGTSRTKSSASAAARKRAATLEMVLLWLGVEATNVIVHHTESQSASVDYLSRLVGKLGVAATSSSSDADGGASASRTREQFEAQAAWKPDYAALKLLAPQHACSASHADTQGHMQQQTALHPLMKAYFAVLCAVPRMTPRCAIAVMRKYGTLADLLAAYKRCESNEAALAEDGKSLLADLLVHNANGSQSRLGPKLSGVVHLAFTAQDPNQKLK